MALAGCRTCGETVAEDAKVCPHCGTKEPTLNRAGRILVGGAGFIGFAIFVIVAMVVVGALLSR